MIQNKQSANEVYDNIAKAWHMHKIKTKVNNNLCEVL